MASQKSKHEEAGGEVGTHLTVDMGCSIHENKANCYRQEGGNARNGVYLPSQRISPRLQLGRGNKSEVRITTDPYRPAVGETPSNYTPFIVQGSEEFPARVEDWVMGRTLIRGD